MSTSRTTTSIASRKSNDHTRPWLTSGEAFEDTTLDPGHPRGWRTPVASMSSKAYRQILGLNPFKTSYFSLYRSLETRRDQSVAGGAFVFAVAAGLPLPIIGLIFGKLINSFPPTEDELRSRISELLGVAVGYFLVTALYTTMFGLTSEKISMNSRKTLLDCLLHLDQSYLDTHDIDINGLLTEKIDTIHLGCSEKIGIFIQSISYFFAAFVVAFILSPKLAGILLAVVVPSMILIVSITSRQVSKFSTQIAEYSKQANAMVESSLRAVKVVQAFDMTSKLGTTHTAILRSSARATIRKAIVTATQTGAIFFTAYAVNALAFYTGSRMASSDEGGGDAGTVFAVVLLILDSSFVVAQFAPFLDIFARAAAARESIQQLLDARAAEDTRRSGAKGPICSLRDKAICFEAINFAYPARPTAKVLDSLSLTLQPGAFTAIVGTSGGGKSTLISLLTGAYDYTGNIHIGTQELRSLEPSHIKSQIAVLEQEPVLFTGTIFENICSGIVGEDHDEEIVAERCMAAARDAAVDFVGDLPRGIHTHIGNGLQLSGGQKQRICLARALIRKPALLVLDEPTSALDARSEVLVMQAVKRAAATGTTVLMVAHRLSTVLDSDAVIVIGEGRTLESGTPADLARDGTVFKQLLDAQNTSLTSFQNNSTDELSEKSDLDVSTDSLDKFHPADTPPVAREIVVLQESMITSQILRRLGAILRPDAAYVALGVVASIFSGALLVGEAIVFGNLIELLNTDTGSTDFQSKANFFCLMFFVLACVALISWVCSGSAFGIASSHLVERIQERLLRQLLSMDQEFFAVKGHGLHDLMGAFTKDTGDLSCLSGAALGVIFMTMTSVFGGIILAHVVAWKIAVVLLAAVPVMLAAGFTRLRVLISADDRRRVAYGEAASLAVEACRSRRTVTVFGLEDDILAKYSDALQDPYKKSRVFTVWSNIMLSVSFAISYFVYALAYWWGSKQVRNGTYSQRQFFTVLPALLFSAQAAGQLFSLCPELVRARAAASNVFRLLENKPHILNAEYRADSVGTSVEAGSTSPTEKVSEIAPKLDFDNVSLAYAGGNGRRVLRKLDLAILPGQTVALVGPSGAGKSSAVALVERFYDPTLGCVRLDGVDLRDTNAVKLRDKIGLVPQEPNLLQGSIAYNIKLGAASTQSVTDDDVVAVCKQCGLHEFVASLPDGYNTDCGSNGSSQLSGGQGQRIALARALIRDPEILLLDEPTSALDAHSENLVQEALQVAAEGRTTVIVAHRLASIQHADRIYVFDGGRIVEEGSHAELVNIGGLYASMAKAQSLL